MSEGVIDLQIVSLEMLTTLSRGSDACTKTRIISLPQMTKINLDLLNKSNLILGNRQSESLNVNTLLPSLCQNKSTFLWAQRPLVASAVWYATEARTKNRCLLLRGEKRFSPPTVSPVGGGSGLL